MPDAANLVIWFMLGLTLMLLAATVLARVVNTPGLLPGFLLNCTLLCGGFTFLLYAANSGSTFLNVILFGLAFAALFVLLFGVYILIALLLINARAVAKRERRSLANRLTLLLALGLIALLVVSFLFAGSSTPIWLQAVWAGLLAVLGYHFLQVFNFLSSFFLGSLARPRLRQNYVVVLGSGLVNGKVTPLLGARIDKAIRFYQRQKKRRAPPKLVMSGGQGADEPMPEAEAMRTYAMVKGVPAGDILVEDRSKNTLENMKFSKELMDAASGGEAYRCIFSTSSYHVLRASIYAQRAGLRATGIGAKTALYYLPNALLREYIALLGMYRKRNIVVAALLFLLGVGSVVYFPIMQWLIGLWHGG